MTTAEHHDIRHVLAQQQRLPQEIAAELARNQSKEVRRNLAAQTPNRGVLDLLLVDSHHDVRADALRNSLITATDAVAASHDRHCRAAKALKPISSVLLVTGAGGMFGAVILASGIGDALADSMSSIGLPPPIAIFVVTAIMRVSLGGTTIAITTSAGFLGATIVSAGLDPLQTAELVLVMAGGSAVLPLVNDASFWLIGRMLGMTVPQTLVTWIVLETRLGTIGANFATIIFYLAS